MQFPSSSGLLPSRQQHGPLPDRNFCMMSAVGSKRPTGRKNQQQQQNNRFKLNTNTRGPPVREYVNSDGKEHLGSALRYLQSRPFPGPPPDEGPPLRVLPIGGLGEIGMNCMLVGVKDRYIVIDAGLMFPDFTDLGMQKILPDSSFLYQWRDKIEALVITHGHEDHIGALPWVVPALDPDTPVYASSFVMRLIQKRLTEYSLWDDKRFKTFEMRSPFSCGPFQIEAVRVTHSIPDCCGLIMRSDYGTVVHTGDWKIDENPMDGRHFDREMFEALGKEPVALMMSDSTNVLSPGRTTSETVVQQSIIDKVLDHQGKGRVVITQFASNLHRLYGVHRAAKASGRKICFVGQSLNHYLEAAYRDGIHPFDPKELIDQAQLTDIDPNQVLIVTTGSQAEPRAALSLAARDSSPMLKIQANDLVLYSAKVIPGNEARVVSMLNSIAMKGARVMASRTDNLHTSGHAYQDELVEALQAVKPQHFLPVHGEYTFLCEHARLAKDRAGVNFTDVIKNGQMLGIHERRNRNTVSMGSMAVIGEAQLVNYYNDGDKGTGTSAEMAVQERYTLAFEGIIVLDIMVQRSVSTGNLAGRVRVTTRGMWTDQGRLLKELHEIIAKVVNALPYDATLSQVERSCIDSAKKFARQFNNKRPEVICITHEYDPKAGSLATIAQERKKSDPQGWGDQRRPQSVSGGAKRPWESGPSAPASQPVSGVSGGSLGRRRSASQTGSSDGTDEGARGSGSDVDEEGETRRPSSRPGVQADSSSRRSPRALSGQADVQDESEEDGFMDEPGSSDDQPADVEQDAPRRRTRAPRQLIPGPPAKILPQGVLERRRRLNPRDSATGGADPDYG